MIKKANSYLGCVRLLTSIVFSISFGSGRLSISFFRSFTSLFLLLMSSFRSSIWKIKNYSERMLLSRIKIIKHLYKNKRWTQYLQINNYHLLISVCTHTKTRALLYVHVCTIIYVRINETKSARKPFVAIWPPLCVF